MIHPLVRDLYKRALVVGQDYPLGLEYTRRVWKKALRDPKNCPTCFTAAGIVNLESRECQKELHKAVGRGRFMIREMIGVIQLKKYRTLRRRYDTPDTNVDDAHRRLIQSIPETPKPSN